MLQRIEEFFLDRRAIIAGNLAIIIVPAFVLAWIASSDWTTFAFIAGTYTIGAFKLIARQELVEFLMGRRSGDETAVAPAEESSPIPPEQTQRPPHQGFGRKGL